MAEARDPQYSVLDTLQRRLNDTADLNIRRLSVQDVKSVIVWLEAWQLRLAMEVATEDDPVQNAKGRGQVELLIDLNGALLDLAGELASKNSPEGEEESNE